MKIESLEAVVALASQRRELSVCHRQIANSDGAVSFQDRSIRIICTAARDDAMLNVVRRCVAEEVAKRIAKIDAELEALGVETAFE